MVELKKTALLALCVLGLQMLSFGHAEVPDGPETELPLLLRPNLRLDPGAVIMVGQYAHKADVVASALTRLGMQSWINNSTWRIPFVRPDLKLNFAGIDTLTLNSLKVCHVDLENAQAANKGFFLVCVGGPEVNVITRKINMELPVRFLENYQNKWTVTTFVDGIPEHYAGDEYGIIAFSPNQSFLNGETVGEVTNGHKKLGTLVVAGNAREGTLAAAVCLRDILNGNSIKGRQVLRELDKVLIWMVSGEEQLLHSVVVIVRYTGEDTAEIVDIFLF
ncbi:MAG: hypothetical protein HXS48_22315 [Theionarchaea archaeon]|nr:hypothetical protein [Theionarchaea archaeon]